MSISASSLDGDLNQENVEQLTTLKRVETLG
jgi:hypothetical protein